MHNLRGKLVVSFMALTAMCIVGLFASPIAHAAGCGGVETAIISCGNNDNPTLAIIKLVLQIMIGLVGIAAVGALIFAGILYSSASGEQAQVQKAKTMIQNTVIGILLFGGMFLIGNYLIPGGIFGGDITGGSVVSGGSGSSDSTTTTPSVNITVASYNIRASDLTSWDSVRANSILDYLETVDISGIQEGRDTSIKWLTPRMKDSGYARSQNEWARQVFWKSSKFSVAKQGTKNLDSIKDMVWVKLKEKTSGKYFYFATTHLDVNSGDRRTSEIKTAMAYIKSNMKDAPVIFVGDMNSVIGSSQDKLIKSYGFKSAYDIAKTKTNTSYSTTLQDFTGGTTGKIDTSSDHQIDHIYIKGDLSVSSLEVVRNKGSDHLPLEATITIPSSTSTSTSQSTSTVSLSGVENFRDVATLNSGLVKPGLLYRSSKLEKATDSDKTKLASILKNGTIIDLRTVSVRKSQPDPAISGVSNVNYPINGASSIDGYKKEFIQSASGRASFKKALEQIAASSTPTLVHCTAGKDRTGWTIALVMYILGANDKQVMTEYLKSKDAGTDYNVEASWLNGAISAATNNGKRSMLDFITASSDGLGVSNATITAIKTKLGVK